MPRAAMRTGFTAEGLDPAVSGGTFDAPVELEMYSPTQGASITYSAGGPWKLYHAPITISATTTIEAKAIRYGFEESVVTVASVTISPQDP